MNRFPPRKKTFYNSEVAKLFIRTQICAKPTTPKWLKQFTIVNILRTHHLAAQNTTIRLLQELQSEGILQSRPAPYNHNWKLNQGREWALADENDDLAQA